MDYSNLINVQYRINYDQNKLQTILKSFDNKITKICSSYEQINNHILTLNEYNKSLQQKQSKLQLFTIQSIKATANQLSTLKQNLKKQLGSSSFPSQQKDQFSSILSTKLSSFEQQKAQLNNRLSQLKTQIIKTSQNHSYQTNQIKDNIKNNNQSIKEQINNVVNKKISILQKQIQMQNKQFIKKRISKIDQNMNKIINQQNQQIRKSITSSEMNRSQFGSNKKLSSVKSINKFNGDNINNNNNNNTNTNTNNNNNNTNKLTSQQFIPLINKQPQPHIIQTQQITNQLPTSIINDSSSIAQQSLQHLIQSLKTQLTQLIRSQILQFQTCLSSISQKNNKFQSEIDSLLSQQQILISNNQIINGKLIDIKNQLENNKNSLYDTNEKNRKVTDKTNQIQQKIAEINKILLEYKNQMVEVQIKLNQTLQIQNKKFRQVQNYSRNNQSKRSSLNKNVSLHNNNNSSHLDQSFWVNKLNTMTQRINKIDQKLKINGLTSQSSLPRINSSNNINNMTPKGNNIPSVDILKKDIQKTNQQLLKTNQRLMTMKKNLKQLQSSHNKIPKKIQQLQLKMSQLNQLQQDRLLQLIKQLINRTLTDPFNNNFTNTLKKQIHIKFLQIKHQYVSIWKQIESKVSDRVEIKQLENLKEVVENKDLEIKALVNKKADVEDFKKGIKYLEGKMKEIYNYVKAEEDKGKNKKEYFLGKK